MNELVKQIRDLKLYVEQLKINRQNKNLRDCWDTYDSEIIKYEHQIKQLSKRLKKENSGR